MSLWGFTNHYNLYIIVNIKDSGFPNFDFRKYDPFVEEPQPDMYVIDPNFLGWSILCLIYFICDPVIGFVSYFTGVSLMRLAYTINALDI